MNIELPEPLMRDVGVSENTTDPVFHLLTDDHSEAGLSKKSVCGNVNLGTGYYSGDIVDIEEAIDEGRRPCMNCVKWAQRYFDVDIKECTICDRVKFIHNIVFTSMEIPHAKGEEERDVCFDCIDIIKEEL